MHRDDVVLLEAYTFKYVNLADRVFFHVVCPAVQYLNVSNREQKGVCAGSVFSQGRPYTALIGGHVFNIGNQQTRAPGQLRFQPDAISSLDAGVENTVVIHADVQLIANHFDEPFLPGCMSIDVIDEAVGRITNQNHKNISLSREGSHTK